MKQEQKKKTGSNMAREIKRRTSRVSMDLCFRIERMCRYSPLDDKEFNKNSMADRRIVEGLYHFYKGENDDPETVARQARANAIRLLLCEALS